MEFEKAKNKLLKIGNMKKVISFEKIASILKNVEYDDTDIEQLYEDFNFLKIIVMEKLNNKDEYLNENILSNYYRDMKSSGSLLTADEEKKLAIRIKNGDEDAKTEFIEKNLRLVISIATRYSKKGVELLDLIQEGNIGLMTAIKKFDLSKGYRFSTYGTWWIRQAIVKAIADQSRLIRVPKYLHEDSIKIKVAQRDLFFTLNRKPSIEELSKYTGIDIERIGEIRNHDIVPISLDLPIGPKKNSFLGEIIVDRNTLSPEESLFKKSIGETINFVLESTLTEKERIVLELRFGLNNKEKSTLEAIGNKYGVTRERIRQIEAKALTKLRRTEHKEHLKGLM